MSVEAVLAWLIGSGTLAALGNNPAIQFGLPNQPLLGATILPTITRPDTNNSYTEVDIKYVTQIAPHSTRYSPPVPQGGVLSGTMDVKLGDSNTAAEMTADQYDHLLRVIKGITGSTPSIEQIGSIVNWVETQLVLPLEWRDEADRWTAITDAVIKVRGYNGLLENVAVPNPAGHRVAVGAAWSNVATSIYADIIAICQMLRDKGYQPIRFITSSRVTNFMKNNTELKGRANSFTAVGGTLQAYAPGRLTLAKINEILGDDGLPSIEEYDGVYYKAGTNTPQRFLRNDAFVVVCATPRRIEIALANGGDPILLQNTLGYVGRGTVAAQNAPGRLINVEYVKKHPQHIEGESIQVSGAVIQDPEAMAVLTGIN